jgi:Zn-dependent protease
MHDESDADATGMPADGLAASTADEFVNVDDLLEPSAAHDPLYHEVWDKVLAREAKPSARGGGALLLVTAVLFVLSFRVLKFDAVSVVILVAAVFFHELGHYAAMKLFGYTDLRIFFIPFFGGAAAGKKRGGPAWQQGIVLLAGPLPGILLALPLCLAGEALALPQEWVRSAATMFLGMNFLNLLPIEPLDGGRLVQLTLFSRHPLLETLFRLIAVAGLGLLAVFGGWMLGIVALFMLITLPMSYRRAKQRIDLRRARPDLPSDLAALDDSDRQDLYARATQVIKIAEGQRPRGHAQALANTIGQLHTEVVTHPPGPAATVLLLGTYMGSLVVGIVLSVIVALQLRPDLPELPKPPPAMRAAEQRLLIQIHYSRAAFTVDAEFARNPGNCGADTRILANSATMLVPRHTTGLSHEEQHSLARVVDHSRV